MSFMIWLLINLVVLFHYQGIKADVLIIPHSEQTFESYREGCLKENSICTFNVVADYLEKMETPKYNQLILDLDLQSAGFNSHLPGRITEIVETEMISVDQLESLISVLQRAEEISTNKKVKLLRLELTQFMELFQKYPAVENYNYVFLKKPIAQISFEKLKSFSFSPYYKQLNYKEETIAGQTFPFKTGQCSRSQLMDSAQIYFANISLIFAEEENCSWMDTMSEVFAAPKSQTTSKYRLTPTEKNILLWSAVAIGVGLFVHEYEVKFEY